MRQICLLLIVLSCSTFQPAKATLIYSPVDYNPPSDSKGFSISGSMTANALGEFTANQATASPIKPISDWNLTVTIEGTLEAYLFTPLNSEWFYESTAGDLPMLTITETDFTLNELYSPELLSATTRLYLDSTAFDKKLSYVNLPNGSFKMELSDVNYSTVMSYIGGPGDVNIGIIPEPSSVCLTTIGAAALWVFRKKITDNIT